MWIGLDKCVLSENMLNLTLNIYYVGLIKKNNYHVG